MIFITKSPLLQFQGVFADDFSVAVSCTGTGETFMRAGVARRAAYLVRVSFCLWLENRSSFGHNSYLQVEDQGLSAQEASQAALDYMKSRWFLSIKFVFFFNLQIESFLKAGSNDLFNPFLSDSGPIIVYPCQ